MQRKHAVALAAAPFVAMIIACGSPSTTTSTNTAAAAPSVSAPVETSEPVPASDPEPAEEFSTKNLRLKNEFGSFGGTIRVKNNGTAQADYVTVEVTLLDSKGDFVAKLDGITESIPAGKTVTVDLLSTDSFTTKWKTAETIVRS